MFSKAIGPNPAGISKIAHPVASFGEICLSKINNTLNWNGKEALMDKTLDVSNVIKTYGDLKAVNGVTFSLEKGEVFGLLGPNGAGKTTLIESIEGIRTPDSGIITILNKNYNSDQKYIKEHVGIQLQTTGFYKELTIKELLSLYASFYKHHANIDELLKKLDLREKKKTLVKNLSGGMYQRLSLGVALLNEPGILFLDEPTTGLDPNARHLIWKIVREVQGKGTTIFLTTHYMEEAEALCSRVAIMDKGKIIAMNTPAELIKEHIGEKTIEVDFTEPVDVETVKKIDNVGKFWISNTKLTMTTMDPHKTMISLFKLPVKTKDIQLRQGNLEDVFLKLTNRRLSA
jgi:ABC-2 type transport system ATP-binding protein